ncbi:MAG: histidine phosphatase family protein [bacterium]
MLALYLTHPQVTIDPARPVAQWGLNEIGRARLSALAARPWLARITRILSSSETKATQTAALLRPDLPVEIHADLGENDRTATGFLPGAAFETAADAFFAHPDASFRGWETARTAQNRVLTTVRRCLTGHGHDHPVLFVGHGAVGTLLRQALAKEPISRRGDQPAGGGNIFAFHLADMSILAGWAAMEAWQWPQ